MPNLVSKTLCRETESKPQYCVHKQRMSTQRGFLSLKNRKNLDRTVFKEESLVALTQ